MNPARHYVMLNHKKLLDMIRILNESANNKIWKVDA